MSETIQMTITEFLDARIAEDEAAAKSATNAPWDLMGGNEWLYPFGFSIGSDDDIRGSDAEHIARHDPARVLAECSAKRAIIAAHKRQENDDDPRAWIVASEILLNTLAAVYKDHPGYRQEWAA